MSQVTDSQLDRMDDYMSQYNEQSKELADEVQKLKAQKEDLINSANTKIEEGFKKNEELIKKLAQQNSGSKKYKNIEAEMEDQEPVIE